MMRNKPAGAGISGFNLGNRFSVNADHDCRRGAATVIVVGAMRGPSQGEVLALAASRLIGDEFLRRGQFGEAMERFRQCIVLRPKEAEYHYKFACAAWRADDLPLSRRICWKRVYLVPDHPAGHEALALWYVQRGRMGPPSITAPPPSRWVRRIPSMWSPTPMYSALGRKTRKRGSSSSRWSSN